VKLPFFFPHLSLSRFLMRFPPHPSQPFLLHVQGFSCCPAAPFSPCHKCWSDASFFHSTCLPPEIFRTHPWILFDSLPQTYPVPPCSPLVHVFFRLHSRWKGHERLSSPFREIPVLVPFRSPVTLPAAVSFFRLPSLLFAEQRGCCNEPSFQTRVPALAPLPLLISFPVWLGAVAVPFQAISPVFLDCPVGALGEPSCPAVFLNDSLPPLCPLPCPPDHVLFYRPASLCPNLPLFRSLDGFLLIHPR